MDNPRTALQNNIKSIKLQRTRSEIKYDNSNIINLFNKFLVNNDEKNNKDNPNDNLDNSLDKIKIEGNISNNDINENQAIKDFNASKNICLKNVKIIDKNKNKFKNDENNKLQNSIVNNRYDCLVNTIKIERKENKCKTPDDKSKNKLYNIQMDLPKYNRFSKSNEKYNYKRNKSYNENKEIIIEENLKNNIDKNYINEKKIINETKLKSNILSVSDSNVEKKYNSYKYKKIGYIQKDNIKKDRLTSFNIRVFNNKIEENPNKIIKNNGFYFSKYSIYNHEY